MQESPRTAVILIIALAVAESASAQRLAPVDEAEASGKNIIVVSLTPLYQTAIEADEDTGGSELDLFASLKILDPHTSSVGAGRVVFWARLQDNLGHLQPASEMAAKAGLLWPTNDVVVTGSKASAPLLAWAQNLADDRFRVWAGQIWPQLLFVKQEFSGDNPAGFMSRLISNDMAARYYDLNGLGVFAEVSGRRWYAQGSFLDAQAESELDVSSFLDGHWAWVAEGGWRPDRDGGETSVSALVSRVDDTIDVEGETAHSLAFSHDLARSEHTLFGRYTYRRGGAPLSDRGVLLAKPLDRSFFFAWAWNRAFGSDRQQLAAAVLYGEPIEFTDALGFDTQYGLEVFWKIRIGSWLEITSDLQLVVNRDDELEIIPGLRIRVFRAFVF